MWVIPININALEIKTEKFFKNSLKNGNKSITC